jgi:DNA-3-methyladenine glycosylase
LGRFPRSFFSRYTPDVARELLGSVLVRKLEGDTTTGTIVEVEAYRGADDPASHAYRGITKRTAVMFGEAGHAYVYFTYGNHFCINVTTEGDGVAGAVLIRALAPLRGIEKMRERRGVEDVRNLTSGPGKLTKAMGINGSLNGEDLVRSRSLYLLEGKPARGIAASPRIGLSVAKETEWRFFIKGSEFVSGGRTHNYRSGVPADRGVVG